MNVTHEMIDEMIDMKSTFRVTYDDIDNRTTNMTGYEFDRLDDAEIIAKTTYIAMKFVNANIAMKFITATHFDDDGNDRALTYIRVGYNVNQ